MIQRIQSIFLLLASIAFFLTFTFPFASSDQPTPQYFADKLYNVNDHVVLMGLAVLGGVIALVAIFLFKNRALQLRLGYLVLILSILLPLVAFLLVYNEGTALKSGTQINDEFGIFLPVISLICVILANHFIKKDDNIVRSMDRLR